MNFREKTIIINTSLNFTLFILFLFVSFIKVYLREKFLNIFIECYDQLSADN